MPKQNPKQSGDRAIANPSSSSESRCELAAAPLEVRGGNEVI